MFGKLRRSFFHFLGGNLGAFLYNLRGAIGRKTMPKFGNEQKNLFIDFPRRFANPNRIYIGDYVSLGPGAFLASITQYPTDNMMKYLDKEHPVKKYEPRIVIGDRVSATSDLQIVAVKEIIIESDVMFAGNIHINDSLHGYENINQPFKDQLLTRVAPICVESGCWIGQNSIILPGVKIGKETIIGANSLVNCDIPSRSIAFGSPAKVVKQWSDKRQKWSDV